MQKKRDNRDSSWSFEKYPGIWESNSLNYGRNVTKYFLTVARLYESSKNIVEIITCMEEGAGTNYFMRTVLTLSS